MFYEPSKKNHGLPWDPFKAIVAPRPIGWISSMSAKGQINLAPYSFFNGVSSDPPMVMFAWREKKTPLTFIEETREFVCNLATWDLRGPMNRTSAPYPRGVDEMKEAGLEAAPSVRVEPHASSPRPARWSAGGFRRCRSTTSTARPPAAMSCSARSWACYIDERFIKDGRLDTGAMRPIARAGYSDYFVMTPETRFDIRRPSGTGADDS